MGVEEAKEAKVEEAVDMYQPEMDGDMKAPMKEEAVDMYQPEMDGDMKAPKKAPKKAPMFPTYDLMDKAFVEVSQQGADEEADEEGAADVEPMKYDGQAAANAHWKAKRIAAEVAADEAEEAEEADVKPMKYDGQAAANAHWKAKRIA